VSKGQTLSTPVAAEIVVLAADAKDGKLAICAGAGISIPAGLPTGAQLAELLHDRFQHIEGYVCGEPTNLLAVADAAASLAGGLEAVQRVVVELAPFGSAPPSLAHQLLALLVAEDALRLLLTNWDDCVERSTREFEFIQAARTQDEAENLSGQFVLKIHGCCTQTRTLLITPTQLAEAPLWTKIYFQAQLALSTMVFVGIGDIADYAQTRITELAAMVEHARVRVVSPDIVADWDNSAWSNLLPDLPIQRRIQKTAGDFVDELAREWVMDIVREVRNAPTPAPAPWLDAVANAFILFTALEALLWLRRAAFSWKVGTSVVRASVAPSTLEAIGLLARTAAPDTLATIRFLPSSAVLIGDARIDVVICPDRLAASEIEAAARERAQGVAKRLGPQSGLHLLVAASSVRGPKPSEFAAVDVVDPDAPIDGLVGGDCQVPVSLTYVDDVLQAA